MSTFHVSLLTQYLLQFIDLYSILLLVESSIILLVNNMIDLSHLSTWCLFSFLKMKALVVIF